MTLYSNFHAFGEAISMCQCSIIISSKIYRSNQILFDYFLKQLLLSNFYIPRIIDHNNFVNPMYTRVQIYQLHVMILFIR